MPLYIHRPHGRLVRLAVRCCAVCGVEVTQRAIDKGDVTVTRIGGDSSNGYEPTHLKCVGIVPPSERLTPTHNDNDDNDWSN